MGDNGNGVRDTGTGAFDYQPALDGVRAVSVVLVLLFHQGFAWMTGGYVGVSVFFTLSGYLITSLMLLEHQGTGRVSFSKFYTRRIKRLMPASLLCLVAVSVLAAAGEFARATALRGDVTAAALQVANWRELTRGTSYAQLIQGGASPVDHFWSLSVEEQFYWVWPLLFTGIVVVFRGRRQVARAIVALAAVSVVAAPLIAWHWGPDVAYWATPARLGEILVGAALAAVFDIWHRRPAWLGRLAWPSLAVIVFAAVRLPSDHGLAYGGWLGAGALVSIALVAGLQVPGALRSLLSLRPIVGLGRISYGVYLYHWPVYVLLDAHRMGFSGVGLFAVRIATTLAIAIASYFLVERPVRRSSLRLPVVTGAAAMATACTVVIALLAVPSHDLSFGADHDLTDQVSIAPTTGPLPVLRTTTTVPTGTVPPDSSTIPASTVLPVPARPVRILVLGDSTAEALSAGLVSWAADHPTLAQVDVLAKAGCGFVRSQAMEGDDGTFEHICSATLENTLPAALVDRRPDLVVVLVTLPDAYDRSWSSSEGMIHADDPRIAARLLAGYEAMAATLLAVPDLRIAWLTAAQPASWWVGHVSKDWRPSLWDGQNAAIDAIVAAHPGRVTKVDFGDWITSAETTMGRAYREDGLHTTPAGAWRIVDERLAWVLLSMAVGAI